MALEKGRNLFKNLSEPLVSRLEGVNPATLTWLTLPTGLTSAWLMMEAGDGQEGALMFFGAAVMMVAAMALDGLDGNLARATGQVTRWGDYLDHTLDRVLDVSWVVAMGYNVHWVDCPELGWFAAMTMMFGSYLGTQAQAAAGSRNYGGFSRADRMMLTWLAIINTALMAFMGWSDPAAWFGLGVNPLSLMVIVTALGGIYTYGLRFRQARSVLQGLDKEHPLSIEQNDGSSEE